MAAATFRLAITIPLIVESAAFAQERRGGLLRARIVFATTWRIAYPSESKSSGAISNVSIYTGRHSPHALFIFIAALLPTPGHASETSGVPTKEAQAAAEAPTIEIEAQPGWVKERNLPEATPARIERAENGIANLLVDGQYRLRTDGHDAWFRFSSKITNRSGIESAGQISVTYDPSFESVSINFVRLIRNGKVIDLTRETKFRVVEREGELDSGIVSGTLKAIANLRDVRVGDIVEYAMTTHTRTSLWPGHAFYHFTQRFSEPLALRTLRVIWPAGLDPQYKAINSDIFFTARKTDGGGEWEWMAQDPAPVQSENNVPASAFQWGRLDVSTMRTWAELGTWAAGLYQGDETLPKDFVTRLDAIGKASPAPADRLSAVTRYIQDNIRYVGEELGEGSYVPRRPATVLARGYGDCKDKSLLLALALRHLGIDAVPALVSTGAGDRLPDRLPSPLLFDHVIVRAVVDGKVTWLDPTGTHRGGQGLTTVPADLGYALPIRTGQAALEHIEGFDEHAGRADVLEQFTVDETANTPLTLHVETRFTDARADNIRAIWSTKSAQSISESNLKFYRQRFPGIVESKSLELNDDRNGNRLTMIENYAMSRKAFVDAKIPAKLITRAYLLQDVLPDRQVNPRIQPLSIAGHVVNGQTIEVHVKDRVLTPLEDVEAKGGPIRFSRRSTKLPDGLSMVYHLETGTANTVPATEAAAIYTVSDQVKDELGIEFYLDKAPRADATPNGIDAASWAQIKADIEKALSLMGKADEASRLEALSLLSAAADKVPHPSSAAGMIDGLKGAILSDLRRPQAALVALQSGTAQYEGNPEVFRLWIAYEVDLGTPQSFAKAVQRTSKLHPDIVASLDKKWVQAAMGKTPSLAPDAREAARQDICIALADAGWQQEPGTAFGNAMLGCAIAGHSLRGELAEARAGLTKNVPTNSLVSMAIDRRHAALWPELDRLGADRYRKNLEHEANRAATAAKTAPKDYAVATHQMRTLRALGRFQEALGVGKHLAADKAQIEIVGSDAFWLVNEYANDLRYQGHIDDAIVALDNVLALGVDRYPELGSLVINRSEMAIAAGHFQKAFDDLTELERKRFDHLSAYGKMWVWANQACALWGLGELAPEMT